MPPKGFGSVIAVTFTLNYIIGTGFLTLPWAFFASGDVLATAVLLFITFLAVCSALMILESMARAAAISPDSSPRVHGFQHYSTLPTTSGSSVCSPEDGKRGLVEQRGDNLWQVGERRIEIVELCERFYPAGRPYFIFILSVYMYGALWAYCTVFANALATASPEVGDFSYNVYLFLYALVVVPMSCLELSEQVTIQVFYAACRVVMVICMLGSVAFAVYETGSGYQSPSGDHSELDSERHVPYLMKWSGFSIIVPIALYSNIFHHSLPALSEIVADKKQLTWVFTLTLLICFGAYTIIGLSLSTYFGSSILSSSNLNWADFYLKNESVVMSIIYHYIILFPAVDVMSAFPLSAITLGNNIHTFSTSSSHGTQYSTRREVIFFRCLATIPPVLGACFVRDLGVITKYTGITGFAIIFFYPVLLSHRSRHCLIDRGMDPRTHYTCALTSDVCKAVLVMFGVFMVCLTLLT
jgi:amino acid permease